MGRHRWGKSPTTAAKHPMKKKKVTKRVGKTWEYQRVKGVPLNQDSVMA